MRRFAAALLALLGACVAPDPELECDRYATSSPQSRWCGAHRDLVLRFVRMPTDVDGRRARLEWVRSTFYPAVAKATSEDTITALVATLEKEMPTFTRIFNQEHFWAERDAGELNPDLRLPLMLGGFRHAVALLERELHGDRYGSR